MIAQYFNRNFIVSSVYRAVGGAAAIAQALSARVAQLRLGAHIRNVRRQAKTVVITMEDGSAERFDAVVFATQVNQVVAMLDGASPEERTVLQAVRLMPRDRKDWGPVNYTMSPEHDRPMVSIWVNRLLPAYQDDRPLFQTINPVVEPAADRVLQDCSLQRPIVDLATQANLHQLDVLHAQPGRRVFFCGSYAAPGIPLLESAVASALHIAQADAFKP